MQRTGRRRKASESQEVDNGRDPSYAPSEGPSSSSSDDEGGGGGGGVIGVRMAAEAANLTAPQRPRVRTFKRRRRDESERKSAVRDGPPTRIRRAAAAAAAVAMSPEEQEAAREAKEAKEEEAEERAEERAVQLEELMRRKYGGVFASAEAQTDTNQWQSWIYDDSKDIAASASALKTVSGAESSKKLGLTLSSPFERFSHALTKFELEAKKDWAKGWQWDGEYCWACEYLPTVEQRGQTNPHLEHINRLIYEGYNRDPHLTCVLIQQYYATYIGPHTQKLWRLRMIYRHIFEHLKDSVYIMGEMVQRTKHVVDQLFKKDVTQDKVSVESFIKLTKQLHVLVAANDKLILARRTLQSNAQSQYG